MLRICLVGFCWYYAKHQFCWYSVERRLGFAAHLRGTFTHLYGGIGFAHLHGASTYLRGGIGCAAHLHGGLGFAHLRANPVRGSARLHGGLGC